jgi:hypothetical protein
MGWSETDSTWYVGHCLTYCTSPGWEISKMRIGRGSWSSRRKSASMLLCPPQIPHDLTWDRKRAAAVGSRRLTAWFMSWPYSWLTAASKCLSLNWHHAGSAFRTEKGLAFMKPQTPSQCSQNLATGYNHQPTEPIPPISERTFLILYFDVRRPDVVSSILASRPSYFLPHALHGNRVSSVHPVTRLRAGRPRNSWLG